ncbi:MAG: hypothetical protein HY097_06925 [Nitrospinae bacterium]|nr:hypothetical protein [Nitrospinota bacterium]
MDKSNNKTLSRIRQQIWHLQRERLKYYRIVLWHKPMIKGSFVEKYKVCGNKNCRCAAGERHGPFKYLSISEANKTTMVFVRRGDETRVGRLAGNYKVFRTARSKILAINQEITRLIDRIEVLLTEPYPEECDEQRRKVKGKKDKGKEGKKDIKA